MILDEICEQKRGEVDKAKSSVSLSEIEDRIEEADPARDFRSAIRHGGVSLIAEVKRASPSKGVLMEDMDPATLGSVYEHSGAAAISVLTDEQFFKGSLADLVSVRRAVAVPCLRKEFIIDPYQIYESRAAGADAILLIVRILSDVELKEFLHLAGTLGMACLVETHDAAEIERALNADAGIIGINNRDLSTFDVDLDRTLEIKKMVPGGKILVSESGIHTREDVRRLDNGGIDAILVGEALVTSDDIKGKIHELLGRNEG